MREKRMAASQQEEPDDGVAEGRMKSKRGRLGRSQDTLMQQTNFSRTVRQEWLEQPQYSCFRRHDDHHVRCVECDRTGYAKLHRWHVHAFLTGGSGGWL